MRPTVTSSRGLPVALWLAVPSLVGSLASCDDGDAPRSPRTLAAHSSATASSRRPSPTAPPASSLRTLHAKAPARQASAPPSASSRSLPVDDTAARVLACLARHYVGRPTVEAGRHTLALPGGGTLAFDDGRSKTFEEELASPDVEDAQRRPYVAGPISPVTTPDHDPGRVRLDALLKATYGASAHEVSQKLEPIRFAGKPLSVHRRAKAAFERVAERVERLLSDDPSLSPYFAKLGGTFNWRTIAGTTRQSAHSYGISLDLDPSKSHYWRSDPNAPLRWKNAVPAAIVHAFEAEGFIWGGRWYHYDTMHFEYRPELFDPECRLEGAGEGGR